MNPVIVKTLRSRWFSGCIHASLWLLLYLAVTHLGGKTFAVHEADSTAIPPQCPIPVAGLSSLFSAADLRALPADTNSVNPFFTRYFMPPPSAPPTTRKIEVTYQGFYQTTGGPKQAVCKVADIFVAAAVGAKVTANLFIADATMQSLTLTNPAALTNILPLNVKKEIVVPIQ
jgi:hypothetical protein